MQLPHEHTEGKREETLQLDMIIIFLLPWGTFQQKNKTNMCVCKSVLFQTRQLSLQNELANSTKTCFE